MKNFIAVLVALFLLALPAVANACEIIVSVDGSKKESYKPGDVVVVKITVTLEHRNCEVDINETDITVSGSQIAGATKWVNTGGKTWERKIKVKITGDKTKRAVITAERTCNKDGGKGSLTLVTSN